jgi:hypothetical protein
MEHILKMFSLDFHSLETSVFCDKKHKSLSCISVNIYN